jgi:Aminotransferase class I and II
MIGHAAGVLLSREELQRASAICTAAGAWLIIDNTYEHFTYGGAQHECVHGPHIINIFSFSKVRMLTRPSFNAQLRELFNDLCATCQTHQQEHQQRKVS